jgi:hypothetical protein
MQNLTKGTQVKINAGKGDVAEMFIGRIGTVVGKCGLYPDAFTVKIEGSGIDWFASYYPSELSVVKTIPITPDLVIKAKDADGNDCIPIYYENLQKATIAFRRIVRKHPDATEIALLDNNTGEVLVSVEHGIVTHELEIAKEITASSGF